MCHPTMTQYHDQERQLKSACATAMDLGKACQANADHVKFMRYVLKQAIQDFCMGLVNGLATSVLATSLFAICASPAAWTTAAISLVNVAYAVHQKLISVANQAKAIYHLSQS